MQAKKTKKTLAISLASILMASVMALPTSAASDFTPSANNFVPLFDFDKVPTAKYTDGYEPGDYTKDTIGDGRKKQCIIGEQYGICYTLKTVAQKGYKGLCLQQTVTENAPETGSYDPIALHSQYGENKLPGVKTGTADALVFWVDFTGFKKHTDLGVDPGNIMNKGMLIYFSEQDYDDNGNAQENKYTSWEAKPNSNYYLLINGKWTPKTVAQGRDIYITADCENFRGWVKIPFDQMAHCDFKVEDCNNKIDAKQITEINIGSGNYKSEIGSVLYYDEFGFEGNFGTVTTTTTNGGAGKVTTAIASAASGVTDTTSINSDVSDVSDASDVSDVSEDTTIAAKTTKATTAVLVNNNNENKNNTPWGIIITVIVVVVLAGVGVGAYFFYKKIRKDGYSSFADYFKNRKKTGQDITK